MSEEPILYILMRNDLPSMNVGKALAQASHASNAFIFRCAQNIEERARVEPWARSTEQGFGTVLVLSASQFEIERAISIASPKIILGWVADPTYPYTTNPELASLISKSIDTCPREMKNGQMLLWRREFTCAYIFGTKEELKPILGHLPLHP